MTGLFAYGLTLIVRIMVPVCTAESRSVELLSLYDQSVVSVKSFLFTNYNKLKTLKEK